MSAGIEVPLYENGDGRWVSLPDETEQPSTLEHLDVAGRIVVISGASGVGKGTIIERTLQQADASNSMPALHLVKSSTTRERRADDKEDSYDFIDDEEFDRRVAVGYFLEWAVFGGLKYGSPKPEAVASETSGLIVYEIDSQGAIALKQSYPKARAAVIIAENHETIRQRLIGRGTDSPEKVEARFDAWMQRERYVFLEGGSSPHFIVNRDIDQAVAELTEFMRGVYYSCRENLRVARALANRPPRVLPAR